MTTSVNSSNNASQSTENISSESPPPLSENSKLITRSMLRNLQSTVDPNLNLDDEVADILIDVVEAELDKVIDGASALAAHRNSNVMSAKDVQCYLERKMNMSMPGFGTEEPKPYRKTQVTEVHKQRLAVIKKFRK